MSGYKLWGQEGERRTWYHGLEVSVAESELSGGLAPSSAPTTWNPSHYGYMFLLLPPSTLRTFLLPDTLSFTHFE